MADIVVSSKRKINLFDRVIQSVVIMVNMNKMNRAIDEHLAVIRRTENEEKRLYQENILREIVFVKYQYDIMQREMYELKISYTNDIVEKINSTNKIERLELQKSFLEMEYDRVTKSKFKSREEVKFNLLIISSAIGEVKQNMKDEGKAKRYNQVIKMAEDVDTKIQTEEYEESMYKELFECIDEYVGYINDNYDISKLPSDERELIEFVIETMIKGIESDIDRHMYEYNLIINICKNSYRYFKIIDKIFLKLQKIYDESLESEILNTSDYVKMFKDIYDMKIKTMVNDVHRTIKTEDEYLEYSKLAAGEDVEGLETFVIKRAIETTSLEEAKKILNKSILEEVIEEEILQIENIEDDEGILKEVKKEEIEEQEETEKTKKESKKEVKKKIIKKESKEDKKIKKTATKKSTAKKKEDKEVVKKKTLKEKVEDKVKKPRKEKVES
jgi:hypothetical protein